MIKQQRTVAEPAVMQRDHERSRLTVEGKRTDDGDRCTLLVVQERTDSWVFYPHGAAQLGVRLAGEAAETVARAILAAPSSTKVD